MKYIIFTSTFQLNLLTKAQQLFIDATFEVCPKYYYQILNVDGYFKEINGIMPLIFIPFTSNTEEIYDQIFQNIYKIMDYNKINHKNIYKFIMSDFELTLRNSIKKF